MAETAESADKDSKDIVPSHARECPAYARKLCNWASGVTDSQPNLQWKTTVDKKATPRVLCIPLAALELLTPSIPSVWPSELVVKNTQRHFFTVDINPDMVFPPPSMALEVALAGPPLTDNHWGKLTRLNLDKYLFAWLNAWKDASDAKDTTLLAKFQKTSQALVFHFHVVDSSTAAILKAYQYKEDEDVAAKQSGHSVLTRGRELCAIQDHGDGPNTFSIHNFYKHIEHVDYTHFLYTFSIQVFCTDFLYTFSIHIFYTHFSLHIFLYIFYTHFLFVVSCRPKRTRDMPARWLIARMPGLYCTGLPLCR